MSARTFDRTRDVANLAGCNTRNVVKYRWSIFGKHLRRIPRSRSARLCSKPRPSKLASPCASQRRHAAGTYAPGRSSVRSSCSARASTVRSRQSGYPASGSRPADGQQVQMDQSVRAEVACGEPSRGTSLEPERLRNVRRRAGRTTRRRYGNRLRAVSAVQPSARQLRHVHHFARHAVGLRAVIHELGPDHPATFATSSASSRIVMSCRCRR